MYNYNNHLNFFKQLDKRCYMLVGDLALVMNGYSVSSDSYPRLLSVFTTKVFKIYGVVDYYPTDCLKEDKYCNRLEDTTVYLPTIERTLVECIKYEFMFIDEGVFCDSLERYQNGNDFNYELLLEVGIEFGVDKISIDFWLEETIDFNSN